MTTRPSEPELGNEAGQILFRLATNLEHVSEAWTHLEYLEGSGAPAIASSRLLLAREHELPIETVAQFGREVAALHGRILEALRDRERELAPDH